VQDERNRNSRSHLRLVVQPLGCEADDVGRHLSSVPPRGGQLTLFAGPSPDLVVIIGVHLLHGDGLAETLIKVKPGVVVDIRLSPRFDLGSMTRRSAFALFRELGATYLDLFGSPNTFMG
jgi:hypothetical protein